MTTAPTPASPGSSPICGAVAWGSLRNRRSPSSKVLPLRAVLEFATLRSRRSRRRGPMPAPSSPRWRLAAMAQPAPRTRAPPFRRHGASLGATSQVVNARVGRIRRRPLRAGSARSSACGFATWPRAAVRNELRSIEGSSASRSVGPVGGPGAGRGLVSADRSTRAPRSARRHAPVGRRHDSNAEHPGTDLAEWFCCSMSVDRWRRTRERC